MKRLLTILLVSCSVISFSQSVVNRAGPSNTVSDARLQAQYNLFIPRLLDTTAALTPPARGLDTCGAIIYTYDVDAFWYRACSPFKHWARVGAGSSLPSLPDGLYSGGDVAWTGTGLIFSVTPAIYVLNGIPYAFNGGNITLTAADPTFDRIDVIILDSAGASYVTGVPSANPQEPSINPQTQIRRAIVTVPANSPIPAIVTQIVYDENLGTPSEWDVTSTGTVVFGNTNFPYHLTIAAAASNFVAGQTITATYTDTINSGSRGNLVMFIRLGAAWSASQNFNVNLWQQDTLRGQTLNFTMGGLSKGIINGYQVLVFPFSSFSPSNLVFDKIVLTAVGLGTFPAFNLDYIQFQTGIIPVLQIPDQRFAFPTGDNFANENRLFNQNGFPFDFNNGKVGFNTTSTPTHTITIGNEINGNPSMYLYNPDGQVATVEGCSSCTIDLRAHNSISGIRFIPNYASSDGFIVVSGTPANYTTLKFISGGSSILGTIGLLNPGDGVHEEFAISPTQNNTYLGLHGAVRFLGIPNATTPDSLVTITGDSITRTAFSIFTTQYFNANIGAGFRLAVPGTNNIKTLFSNVTGAWDSASNANALTFKVDTTVMATRAYANNLLATYFNSNVGSGFRIAIPNTNNIKTLLSGYALTWDSATSNSNKISIDTTLMATRAYVGAAGGAGTVSSVSFNNANGFGGSWSNPTTTPQLTLTTTITGVLKGNGTAISAATVGTDYSVGTSALATGLLKSTTTTGALSIAVANTDYVTPSVTTLSSLISVGTMTTGSISTGFIVRGVTITLGSDASFDTYYRSAGGVLTRLANGTTGQVLTATTGAAPSWQAVAATLTINSSLINSGTSGRILFQNASNQVSQNANLFFDVTNNRIQSRIFLNAGAAAANSAPLKFTAGTNLTTAEAGAVEYDANFLYFTPTGTTRKRFIISNNVAPTAGQGLFGNGTDFTVGTYSAANNSLVVTPSGTGVTVRINSIVQTLTDAATTTFNVANGNSAVWTIGTTGRTLNMTNFVSGITYVLKIIQGAGGSKLVSAWPANTKWHNGTPPTLSTAAGAVDIVTFWTDGTNLYGEWDTNYQ